MERPDLFWLFLFLYMAAVLIIEDDTTFAQIIEGF